MTGLPKFVRDKMAGTPVPSSHPDADLLTAFAENGLTGKERQQVVDHLAACSDCREIVFLAQPEVAETQETFSATPTRARRFRWMAWGSVAAVVIVVGSAVVLQREKVIEVEAPAPVAVTRAPVLEAKSDEIAKENAPAAPADVIVEGRKDGVSKSTDTLKAKAAPPPQVVIPKSAESDKALEYMKPVPPAGRLEADQKVAGGAVPSQNVNGPMQQDMQISQQRIQVQGPANSANTNLADANAIDGNANKVRVAVPSAAKAQKKESAGAAVNGIVAGYSQPQTAPAAALARVAPAQWRISDSGDLERSYGGNVWTPVLQESGRLFRVVSVIANTVWAGGDKGALFVSRNGGANWEPVKIKTSGDIVSIQFADLLNASLQTSDGENWKTSDAGKTWQKQ